MTGPAATSNTEHRTRWQAAAWWLLWVVLSLLVFALYMRPDFLLTVADQLWSCM